MSKRVDTILDNIYIFPRTKHVRYLRGPVLDPPAPSLGQGESVINAYTPPSLNKLEYEVYRKYLREGWQILRSGWPDFLAVRGSELLAIEVKGKTDRLSARQVSMLSALADHIPVIEAREGQNVYDSDDSVFHELPFYSNLEQQIKQLDLLRARLCGTK